MSALSASFSDDWSGQESFWAKDFYQETPLYSYNSLVTLCNKIGNKDEYLSQFFIISVYLLPLLPNKNHSSKHLHVKLFGLDHHGSGDISCRWERLEVRKNEIFKSRFSKTTSYTHFEDKSNAILLHLSDLLLDKADEIIFFGF